MSDLAIFGAYVAIPCVLAYFVRRRKDVPFPRIFWLFVAFIFFCGTTHLIEAILFWYPVYRVAAVVKFITAAVSLGTVAALFFVLPVAMRLPGLAELSDKLEREVEDRRRVEERLRRVIESSPVGLVMVDRHGRIELVNEQLERWFGYQREELLGQPIEILVPEKARRNHAQYVAAYFTHLTERPMGAGPELRGRRKDGSEFPVEIGLNPLVQDGQPHVLASIVDISARKEAERQLRISELRNTAIVSNALDCVITMDHTGKIIEFNPAAEQVFGYTRENAIGQGLAELIVPPAFRDRHVLGLEEYLATGKSKIIGRRVEVTAQRRDGSQFPAELAVIVMNDGVGWPVFTGFVRDISDRKRAWEAQRYLAAIVESSDDAIIGKDLNGVITSWNQAATRIFGYTGEEIIGRWGALIIPPDRIDEESRITARLLKGERIDDRFETLRRCKDGRDIHVSLSISPIKDESGTIIGLAKVVRDITQHKQAEERFRQVVESSPNALLTVNSEGRIVMVNRQTERWFGYSREELVGQPIEILVPAKARQNHPHYVATYFTNPTVRPMGAGRDLHGRRKDGSEFPVEIGLSSFMSKNGMVVLASVVDITERKESERLLREHNALLEHLTEDLKKRNAELDEFTYVASHDLQEPLRKLVSFSSLLPQDIGGELPERAATDLKYITQAAQRMKTLVQDLLALSRAGRSELSLQSVSLRVCVNRALEALESRIQQSGAQITCDELPDVNGDTTLLTQLFQNLIGNAIKYCNQRPMIHITAEEGPDGPIFGVKDNGIGIPGEYAQQIFAPFKRLHGRDEYEGTGIGLAICRKAVERHGGKIWVHSQPGQGSYFKFTLGSRRKVAV